MDHAMQWYTDHGIHILKTGYAGAFPDGYLHHSQYGVNHYQRVVETAARHQMTLDAHEPISSRDVTVHPPAVRSDGLYAGNF